MLEASLLNQLKPWVKHKRPILTVVAGVTVALITLRLLGILLPSELAALDQLFRLRPAQAVDERIVIVGIDEVDLSQVGKFPIPDQVIAELLKKLDSYHPRAIGLDIYRFGSVEPGHEEFVEVSQSIPHLIGIERLGDQSSLGVPPPPVLNQRQQVGFNNVVVDTDGRVRRNLLYWHTQGVIHQSFALQLALIYLQGEGITPRPAAANPEYLQLGQSVFRPLEPSDGGYVHSDTKGYQILANFQRPGKFRTISMTDVLRNQLPQSWLRDRIILIGSTADSFKDFFYIPYSGGLLGTAKPIFGVELQANFVSQILSSALDQRPLLKVLSEPWEWLWIFGWSGLGATLIWQIQQHLPSQTTKDSDPEKPVSEPRTLSQAVSLWSLFTRLFLVSAGLFGSCYLAFLTGWWLPFIPALLGLLGSATVMLSKTLLSAIRDLKERQQLEEELREAATELNRFNSELQLSGEQWRYLANHDPLTGLANRQQFYESLSQCLDWASNHNQLIALMYLDLDGFKQVNDTLGHSTGDQLLQVVAQRLTTSLRESDVVSRLGGDEFTVILPGIPQAEYAAKVAQKILGLFSQVFVLEGKNATVTVSIGISIFPLDGELEETLIEKADAAMYRAKQLGRNQYQFSSLL